MMRYRLTQIRMILIIVCLTLVDPACFDSHAFGLEIVAMAGAPNFQNSPSVTAYASISNFQTNTGGSTTYRNTGQFNSCDIALLADGTFYSMTGDASNSDNKTMWSWPSITDWSTNTNFTNHGTRSNAAAVSGMAIYQNELYVLEGAMDVSGLKTLMKWPSVASWTSNATGTAVGSRSMGSGIGFDIGLDGTVYFLQVTSNSSPNFANQGILYTWPTITDFLNDSNVSSNGGQFSFFGGTDFIAGLAVPEPSTYVMAALSSLALVLAGYRRQRRMPTRNHVSLFARESTG